MRKRHGLARAAALLLVALPIGCAGPGGNARVAGAPAPGAARALYAAEVAYQASLQAALAATARGQVSGAAARALAARLDAAGAALRLARAADAAGDAATVATQALAATALAAAAIRAVPR